MTHVGYYPGSFDPVTFGHLDVIQRACRLVDILFIAVGTHHEKAGLFTHDERINLLKNAVGEIEKHGTDVRFVTFDNLVVDAMREAGAGIMIRGLRDTTDYNYEMQLAGMNATMAPDIQIVFLPAASAVRHISASLVRQIASMGGDISGFVPKEVASLIRERIGQ